MNKDVLLPALQKILKTRTTAEWMKSFGDARITSGVVRDTGEVANSEQFRASELLVEMNSPGRQVRSIRTPVRYDSFEATGRAPAPDLDADREIVFAHVPTASSLGPTR